MSDTLDGVLVVDKPSEMTSHDVVAAVRRRLPRGTKVGHTGTLDPFATGVLPVVVGRATRLSRFLTSDRKRYVAEVAFGSATDTADATGREVARVGAATRMTLSAERVAEALARLVGTHPQVPPAHSAKKVDGERAYALARRGLEVELPAVEVTAHALTMVQWDPEATRAVVELDTSAGYYVRSLARDLGEALGVPAHLAALRRTRSGPFRIEAARPLSEVLQADRTTLGSWLVPMGGLLEDVAAVTLRPAQAQAVRHGQPFALDADQTPDRGAAGGQPLPERIRLLDDTGALVALARPSPQDLHLLHADVVLQ